MQNNAIKSQHEIEIILRAVEVVDNTFDELLNFFKEGVTEIEVAEQISKIMKSFGASDLAFDTIVAFGENGAEPHHVPTCRKLRAGDFVTIDMGAKVSGYCSDFTRTFAFRRAEGELKRIYDVVRYAKILAERELKEGADARYIDTVARDYIIENGYGEFYIHGTGHGVGTLIHEEPTLNQKSVKKLENNMVVTVEPGIYINGIGGVRIEDMIVINDDSPIILTGAKKDMIIL